MNEEDRIARAMKLREEALRWLQADKERRTREAAIDNCDQCPEPKAERIERRCHPNGIELRSYGWHCDRPGPACTSQIQVHLTSIPADLANRIILWMAEQPELAALGVSWLACLAPPPGTDRLILTYRVPVTEQVAKVVGSLRISDFRTDPINRPCERCGQPISEQRLMSVPDAARCWDCQTEVERAGPAAS